MGAASQNRTPDTQLFRDVFNASPIGIAVENLDGQPLFVNPTFCSMLGFSEVELRGKHCVEFSPPEDAEKDWALFQQLRAGAIDHYQLEKRYFRKDGSLVWGRLTISLLNTHPSPLVIAMVEDITDKQRAEEARAALLQSREELLKIFVKHVPAAVAMLDRDMRYLQMSERWCADFLLDGAKTLGRSHYEIFPDIPDRWRQIHRRAMAGETLRAEEDRWDREGGGTTWLRWEIRPWQNLDGVPGGILIFSEDITHRKHAEEALASLSGRLIEAQDEERKRIAREIHDDYSQRLALLAIDLENLDEEIQNPSAEARQKLHRIWNGIGEIGADLHSLSHRLYSSTLDSLGLVAGAKAFCSEFAEQQEIQVDFADENVPREVPGDVVLCLFRVVQEGLRNIKRHSGGDRAEVRLEYSGEKLHLSVADRGRGFDVNNRSLRGGIGIRSMEERLRLLGGKLEIQSRPMEGTRIDAWLPLKMASAA